jgi:hypothetical protein
MYQKLKKMKFQILLTLIVNKLLISQKNIKQIRLIYFLYLHTTNLIQVYYATFQ